MGIAFILVVMVGAAFSPSLSNGWLNWDDDGNFLSNLAYRGLGWAQLRWCWTTFKLGVYQPLFWMMCGLEYELFHLDAGRFHLISIILQAITTVAVYDCLVRILNRATGRRGDPRIQAGSALAACLWGVHPLRTEVVAWVSCQPYIPCALFAVLSVSSYLRAQQAEGRTRRICLAVSMGLFVASLLSHATSLMLPIAMLILDWYPLRRMNSISDLRRLLIEKVPYFGVSGVFFALAIAARSGSIHVLADADLTARTSMAAYSASFYLEKSVAPFHLAPLYPIPRMVDRNTFNTRFLSRGILIATITGVAFALRRARPGLLAAWLAYLILLLPNSGLLTYGRQIAADRYSYISTLPLVALAAWLLSRGGRGLLAIAVCAIAVLVALSRAETRFWRDTETLWKHALEWDGTNSTAHYNLGVHYSTSQRLVEAREHLETALKYDPGDADTLSLLALLYADTGDSRRAAALMEKVETRTSDTTSTVVLTVSATFQCRAGNLARGAMLYRKALAIDPSLEKARLNLALALIDLGRAREGEGEIRQLLIGSGIPRERLFVFLGEALVAQDRGDEARHCFEEALRIRAGHPSALTWLKKLDSGER
jgi:tetratricopeptide (TPR) repeat protein